jgi:hypothetical protein
MDNFRFGRFMEKYNGINRGVREGNFKFESWWESFRIGKVV